mmetsp:Transcript_96249/g.305392  ORF Transcript_96249/g.305392 Transcript_96249/m.305392 type:complete len:96 (+) Transcript_96249:91-378(+)
MSALKPRVQPSRQGNVHATASALPCKSNAWSTRMATVQILPRWVLHAVEDVIKFTQKHDRCQLVASACVELIARDAAKAEASAERIAEVRAVPPE